ncbi:MAG: ribosome silencing factor, partial [Deltaproteobacteria bacterium]|nr:ribosome silencing factor [Deltaproteobacteria bacterium]
IADAVEEGIKAAGSRPLGVEGYGGGGWILVDCGDMVIHVFSSENRSLYGLEKLWSDATDITGTFLEQ